PVTLINGYNSINPSLTCSNASGYLTGNTIKYPINSLISTYNANMPAVAALMGEVFASILSESLPWWATTIETIVSAFIPINLYSQSNFSVDATIQIWFNPANQFFITIIGSHQLSSVTGSTSAYPSGLIVNYTNYYLNILSCG
ncbi:hypothetical protein, partial [Caldivirga sp.]|uniref:hypothetical protein n=1 Tax=Caldivirga sp. TaxID=2080243 RepID=UPI0025C47D71